MKTGMLWYASDGEIVDNILKVADDYEQKYGSRPNKCLVNVDDFEKISSVEDPMVLGEFLIDASPLIGKWHIWIGEDDQA